MFPYKCEVFNIPFDSIESFYTLRSYQFDFCHDREQFNVKFIRKLYVDTIHPVWIDTQESVILHRNVSQLKSALVWTLMEKLLSSPFDCVDDETNHST